MDTGREGVMVLPAGNLAGGKEIPQVPEKRKKKIALWVQRMMLTSTW